MIFPDHADDRVSFSEAVDKTHDPSTGRVSHPLADLHTSFYTITILI